MDEMLFTETGVLTHAKSTRKRTELSGSDWVEHDPFTFVTGSGGGDSGSANPPTIDDDTHRSNTIARVLLVYSAGETVGIQGATAKEKASKIFFNRTPLHPSGNDDDAYNFAGVRWWQRTGTEDQAVVPGFEKTTSIINIGTQVTKDGGAVTRTVTSASVSAVRVIMGFPSLMETDSDDGDQRGTSVVLRFDVYNPTLAIWQQGVNTTITGKAQNGFEQQFYVRKPTGYVGSEPWLVRVVRITDDSESQYLLNNTFVQRMVEVVDSNETYPGIAYFALEIDTELFGENVPTVALKVSGVKVRVPSNYYEDPSDGEPEGVTLLEPSNTSNGDYPYYHGTWDGTFKWRSTSNPAWHLYHLSTDDENGAGIPLSYMDKYSFYTIAQYCDAINTTTGKFLGVIVNGQTTPSGNIAKRRRRFTLNTQINESDEALSVLQNIASCFRGTVYYGAGAIVCSQDSPKSRTAMFNNASVEGGKFLYSWAEAKNRITVATVQYNDKENFFEPSYATYPPENRRTANTNADIARFGRNEVSVVKFGCDNEEEAYEFAQWIVYTSLNETQTVSFTAGPDQAMLQPGEIIEVYDYNITKEYFGGRIAAGSNATRVNLDRAVTLLNGQNYQITVISTDGKTLITRNITSGSGTRTFVNCASLGISPTASYLWNIKGSDIQPQTFRVVSVSKADDMKYEIFAMQYDASKFAVVEQGKPKVENPYFRTDLVSVNAPTGVEFKRLGVNDPVTGPRNDLLVSWVASTSRKVNRYVFQWRRRGAAWSAPETLSNVTTFTIQNVREGFYDVRILAINVNKVRSLTTEASFEVTYATLGSDTPTMYAPILEDPI